MKSENFQRGFVLLFVAAVSALFFWMIRSFLITLLLAAVFSSLIRPLYIRLTVFTRGRKHAASALTLAIFVLGIILPLFSFIGLVANEAVKVTQSVAPWAQEKMGDKDQINESLKSLPGFHYIEPYRRQIVTKVGDAVSRLGNVIFERASALTKGTFVFFMDFLIMLYAMYFFFVDGPAVLDKILFYVPLKDHDEKKLLEGFRSMTRATLLGIAVIGIIQGAMAGAALWLAGIPSALFWGTLMAVLSIIPNVGSAIVWLPACIYLFIQGETLPATLVLLWCSLIVGTVDNFLRPVLVGKGTNVHELLVFVSTLGGLTMWGLPGFILGPVLVLVFITAWEIYGAEFKEFLPKVRKI